MLYVLTDLGSTNPTSDPILAELQAEEEERQMWIAKVAERDGIADLQHKDTDELKKMWNSKPPLLSSLKPTTNPLSNLSHNLFQQKSKVR